MISFSYPFKKRYFCFFLIIASSVLLQYRFLYAIPAQDIKVINNRNYFSEVEKLIKGAEKSISVIMFSAIYYPDHPDSFSNRLINALIEARKKGVEVEVVLEDDAHNEKSEKVKQVKKILEEGGVTVYKDREDITTHCKLLIIDGTMTVIGSTNWSYSALAKNNESSVVIESKEVAKEYIDYFNQVKS